ncbi:MAG: two-component regulator propeller domain-containing protein [Candidatus Acidiferrum sp.]
MAFLYLQSTKARVCAKDSRRVQQIRILVFVFLLLANSIPVWAQHHFEAFTADNGLPQNVIRGIHQTPDGYLWIATFDGLARFDGVRFTIFNKSTAPGITTNRFGLMLGTPDGDIWLGTEAGGITRYHHGSFKTYGAAEGIPGNIVRGITGDAAGHIWILTGGAIAQWEDETGRFANLQNPSALRYEPLLWDNQGFWAADRSLIHCLIRGKSVEYALPAWLPGKSIWGVASDQAGTIWIETVDGRHASITANGAVSRLSDAGVFTAYRDRQGHLWTIRIGLRLTRSIEDLSVSPAKSIRFASLYEDREQNLWLGSEGEGLLRFAPQSIHTYSKEQGLIDRNVYPVYQDHSGAIWIGAWQSGLSRFEDGKFTNYVISSDLPVRLATSIVEDRRGTLWVSTHAGLSTFREGKFTRPAQPTFPPGTIVQAMIEDRQGTLWFGTSTGLVSLRDGATQKWTMQDGLATDDVRVLVEGPLGELWIGGYGGLTRVQNGQYTRWTEANGLPSNNVRALYIDSDGVVWIGTYDGGLGRLTDGKIVQYTMRQGMFNDGVFQILEDAHGNFWIGCNRGIYRVSKRELNEYAAGKQGYVTSVPYGKTDGMLNVECNGGFSPSGIRAADGKLWFPTQDGVAVVDPEAGIVDTEPPPIEIEGFSIDQVPVRLDQPINVKAGKHNLEVQYTAPSFIKSEQIHFKYRLMGIDPEWTDAGTRRTAYYSHVPPGSYTFRVIAGNSDGIWNESGQSLNFQVAAPFYQTGWFESLLALAAIAILFAAWQVRVLQLQRAHAAEQAFSRQLIASQENERKRIAAELHDSIGQRLVIIKNLALFAMRPRDTASKSEEELNAYQEISEEASAAIGETREISYNLRPFQLDRLGLTKAIEAMARKISSGSGVQIVTTLDNIDDAFPEDARINFYRIVQESLNNIMKHSKATEAEVTVKRNTEKVMLTVSDNGRGMPPPTKSPSTSYGGFGLTGMAERASLLGGEFKVRSAADRGTMLTVEIVLKGKRRAE